MLAQNQLLDKLEILAKYLPVISHIGFMATKVCFTAYFRVKKIAGC